MFRLLAWLAVSIPVAVSASEANHMSLENSGWSPAFAGFVLDVRSGTCGRESTERTTSLYVELKDVAGRLLADDIEVRVYNLETRRLMRRLSLRFDGRPLCLVGVPAPSSGFAAVVVAPRSYAGTAVVVALGSQRDAPIRETLAVQATRVRPRLPEWREIQAEPRWADLRRVLANSEIDETAWGRLDDEVTAGLLNLYVKMQRETLGGRAIFSFVERITTVRPERVYAVVADDLLLRFRNERRRFRVVSGPLHRAVQGRFPEGWSTVDGDGSFKTNDRSGNLQVTFARDAAGSLVADIDIDDHTGLAHIWDVLTHILTGTETHPYDIHDILVRYQRLDPGYDLVSFSTARTARRRGRCRHGSGRGARRASHAIRPRRRPSDEREARIAPAAGGDEPLHMGGGRRMHRLLVVRLALFTSCWLYAQTVRAQPSVEIRIMPPDRAKFLAGQLFDLRVEATRLGGETPPAALRVTLDGRDISRRNVLANDGVGGSGSIPGQAAPGRRERPAARAPVNTTNFLVRDFSLARPGTHLIEASTEGVSQRVAIDVVEWRDTRRRGVRNVILLVGDGMSIAHRTAARVVSRGFIPTNGGAPLTLPLNAPTQGKPAGLLAMDTMEATGIVMTTSLNALVTDSSPGMAAYTTGNKSNNNQQGVFPDNTPQDVFDNPRVEYLGEYLRRASRTRFNLGIVTTADVTDATPAANAVHTADRNAGARIAADFLDERDTHGLKVLMGGGSRHFLPAPEGERKDGRDLVAEFKTAGYRYVANATELRALIAGSPKGKHPQPGLLGLFHPKHMTTAFDKIGGAKGYSRELQLDKNGNVRDQPMLDDMTRAALHVLRASPEGFYLMIEGASIDKRTHNLDAERAIWDTIEFDNAVRVALDFAADTNGDRDPTNDTLVVVTSDHDTAGFALIGVGNERYYPPTFGHATREYVATLRSCPEETPRPLCTEQELRLFPNYVRGDDGFPLDPDPTRKVIIGWAAAPDRYENWISNRLESKVARVSGGLAVANPARDGYGSSADNTTVDGRPVPGILISGQIENGEHRDASAAGDTSSSARDEANHTATDIPLSATGPGADQFVGVYDNTEAFFKIMCAYGGLRPCYRAGRR